MNVFILLSVLIVAVLYILLDSQHHKDSMELAGFCYKQTQEVNLPMTVCSNIQMSADLAYSSARNYNIIVSLLLLTVLGLGAKLFSVNKELENIKEKLNV